MNGTRLDLNGIWVRFTTGADPRTLTTDTHDLIEDKDVTRCGAEQDQDPGASLGKVAGQLTCRSCIQLLEAGEHLDALWLEAWNRRTSALDARRKVDALDAELRRDDLNPSQRAAFIAEKADLTALEAPRRTGRAKWGPAHTMVYAPRWSADHHPWLVKGMDPKIGIRYADYEVASDEGGETK